MEGAEIGWGKVALSHNHTEPSLPHGWGLLGGHLEQFTLEAEEQSRVLGSKRQRLCLYFTKWREDWGGERERERSLADKSAFTHELSD